MTLAKSVRSDAHQFEVERGMQSLKKAKLQVNSKWRLAYHFMTPANWMNDPNGLIFFKGEYHVFYQHNPYAPKWGPMFWGHAKSKNLLHWEHLPIALAPSEFYDYHPKGGGCYSGSAVDNQGTLTLVYTGRVVGDKPTVSQCLATSEDGVVFTKHLANPVISEPPISGLMGFRDPKVWHHEGFWYMVIGSGRADRGLVFLYRSENLIDWGYLGILAESDGTQGTVWECPDLFPIGNKHVLIFSPMGLERLKTMYFVGTMDYETGTFSPELVGDLDFGRDFYAAQTMLDDKGRRLVLGWMDSWDGEKPTTDHSWVGALTVPRELKLGSDGYLLAEPIEELRDLRQGIVEYSALKVSSNQDFIPSIAGDCCEIELELDLTKSTARTFNIYLRCSSDKTEQTVVTVILEDNKIVVDTTRSGVGRQGVTSCFYKRRETLNLRLLLDRSSLEVFVNRGEATITNRIYPQNTSSFLRFSSVGGKVVLKNARLWEIAASIITTT